MSTHPFNKHLTGAATMLVVDDLEKSIAFYRDKLGFEVRMYWEDNIAGLSNGAINLYLFVESPPTPDKPTIHLENRNAPNRPSVIIVLEVNDCHAAYQILVEQGVGFLTPPFEPPWGGWRCFALDPDGYLIELEETTDSPFNKSVV